MSEVFSNPDALPGCPDHPMDTWCNEDSSRRCSHLGCTWGWKPERSGVGKLMCTFEGVPFYADEELNAAPDPATRLTAAMALKEIALNMPIGEVYWPEVQRRIDGAEIAAAKEAAGPYANTIVAVSDLTEESLSAAFELLRRTPLFYTSEPGTVKWSDAGDYNNWSDPGPDILDVTRDIARGS